MEMRTPAIWPYLTPVLVGVGKLYKVLRPLEHKKVQSVSIAAHEIGVVGDKSVCRKFYDHKAEGSIGTACG